MDISNVYNHFKEVVSHELMSNGFIDKPLVREDVGLSYKSCDGVETIELIVVYEDVEYKHQEEFKVLHIDGCDDEFVAFSSAMNILQQIITKKTNQEE